MRLNVVLFPQLYAGAMSTGTSLAEGPSLDNCYPAIPPEIMVNGGIFPFKSHWTHWTSADRVYIPLLFLNVIKMENTLAVFEGKKVRRTWYNKEWWFVVEDIVSALIDSSDSKQYLQKMKQRDEQLAQGWVQIVHILPFDTPGGKQKMNGVNTEGAFRIIQSIPSLKAEPFKLWLAKVGYERVQEIADPELAQKRMKQIYKAKGYSEDWIEKRVRGIAIRDELTDEWGKRGVKTKKEYAILTAEISKATFGMTPGEYKEFKRLKQENLRDHMNDLELIFTMLGERVSTEITRTEDAQGYPPVEDAAKRGGRVAGNARKDTEKELGRPITSPQNYLVEPERKKKHLEDKSTESHF